MIEIIPAVLPKNFKDLEEHLALVRGAAKQVQIDAVDGRFVRNRTWPYRDSASFQKIVKEEHGLPFWEEIDFQFDLMIENPHERVMDFVRAGATHVIIHAASPGAVEALRTLIDLKDEDYGGFSVRTGVAIMPESQPEILEPFEGLYDFVQVMGIAKIGYQGEPFDKRALYLVERLHQRYPALPIQVDGGVSLENARTLAAAGASRLVAGSAIFNTKDPKQALAELAAEANKN